MLLTAVCVLFGHGGRLPEDKFELYDRIVDYVLYNRYPESAGDRRWVRERLGFIAAGMHTGLSSDSPARGTASGTSAFFNRGTLRARRESG